VESFKVSKLGNVVALSAHVFVGMDMDQSAAKEAEIAASRVNAQTYSVPGEFVNRWDSWWPTPVSYSHVFVVKLYKDPATGRWKTASAKEAVDTMAGLAGDCPSRPFGDAGEYDIGPDERSIAFTTQIGSDKRWSTDLNVYEFNLATKRATCLSCANPATDTTPAFSPDGKTIAYLAMQIPKYESDQKRIRLYDRATGKQRDVAADWDRGVDAIQWSADSRVIYAAALDIAREKLFRVDIATNAVTHFAGDASSSGFNIIPCHDNPTNTCALFAKSTLQSPAEIFMTMSNGDIVQKTGMTIQALQNIEFTEVTEFWFKGADGDMVHSWLHKPYGWQEGKKYPIILYCHGGPESPWMDGWSYRWNP
jgi:dipeptidyl aminopeptidase/acylaminoacyl peptidase